MFRRRELFPSLKRQQHSGGKLMKVYRNAVVLLCLPRDQRETLKFRQETSSSCLGRVRWPAVNLKMIGEIWTETSRNRCAEIGCSGYSRFPDGKVTLEIITIHNRGGGENLVTPQTPDKTIEHLENYVPDMMFGKWASYNGRN
jgi:hypothetical protein